MKEHGNPATPKTPLKVGTIASVTPHGCPWRRMRRDWYPIASAGSGRTPEPAAHPINRRARDWRSWFWIFPDSSHGGVRQPRSRARSTGVLNLSRLQHHWHGQKPGRGKRNQCRRGEGRTGDRVTEGGLSSSAVWQVAGTEGRATPPTVTFTRSVARLATSIMASAPDAPLRTLGPRSFHCRFERVEFLVGPRALAHECRQQVHRRPIEERVDQLVDGGPFRDGRRQLVAEYTYRTPSSTCFALPFRCRRVSMTRTDESPGRSEKPRTGSARQWRDFPTRTQR